MLRTDCNYHDHLGHLILYRNVGISASGDSYNSLDRSSFRNEVTSPTSSVLSGSLRKRTLTFDIGVQVKDHDFSADGTTPVLKIVESSDSSVQTEKEKEKSPSPVRRVLSNKNVSVTAKPKTSEIGSLSKVCTIAPSN